MISLNVPDRREGEAADFLARGSPNRLPRSNQSEVLKATSGLRPLRMDNVDGRVERVCTMPFITP